MTPYFYQLLKVRDPILESEVRNAGLLLVSPDELLVLGGLPRLATRLNLTGAEGQPIRKHLAHIVSYFRDLLSRDRESARPRVMEAMKDLARPSEGALLFMPPQVGIADSPKEEFGRLMRRHLGEEPTPPRPQPAKRVRKKVIKAHDLEKRFGEATLGVNQWPFDCVLIEATHLVVLQALDFGDASPRQLMPRAAGYIPRIDDVRQTHVNADYIVVTSGRQKSALAYANDLLRERGAGVVAVEPSDRGMTFAVRDLEAQLDAIGILPPVNEELVFS